MANKYKALLFFMCLPLICGLVAYFYFKSYLHQFLPPQTLSAVVLMLLVSPILEEMVFRGLLQDRVLKHIPKRWCALLVLNLGFALLHYHINASLIYLSLVFISGLIFSYTKVLYLKLVYPICLHIYYNLVYVCVLHIVIV